MLTPDELTAIDADWPAATHYDAEDLKHWPGKVWVTVRALLQHIQEQDEKSAEDAASYQRIIDSLRDKLNHENDRAVRTEAKVGELEFILDSLESTRATDRALKAEREGELVQARNALGVEARNVGALRVELGEARAALRGIWTAAVCRDHMAWWPTVREGDILREAILKGRALMGTYSAGKAGGE